MSNYQEGMIAIFVCLTVFILTLIGTVIYAIYKISETRKELHVERLKVQVLIESMTEIFESKYKLYDKDERNSDDLPRRN